MEENKMEYIIKVFVNEIANKDGKGKFIVYNAYIKKDDKETIKCNVRFKEGAQKPAQTSYIYVPADSVSVSELGNYPTLFISAVNKVKPLKLDTDLSKYFKSVENDENKERPFEEKEIKEEDLPF